LFRALGEPTRLRLLLVLATRGEAPVGALAEATGQSYATISNHLLQLRLTGVVTPRRDGKLVYYRLCSRFVAALLRRVRGEGGPGVPPGPQTSRGGAFDARRPED
jgi:DNA-binding transcriptional ArsR family regulator